VKQVDRTLSIEEERRGRVAVEMTLGARVRTDWTGEAIARWPRPDDPAGRMSRMRLPTQAPEIQENRLACYARLR
jgi:hypothetical protein